MKTAVVRFLKARFGARSIEYALIAAGIVIVIICAVVALGTKLDGTFFNVGTVLR